MVILDRLDSVKSEYKQVRDADAPANSIEPIQPVLEKSEALRSDH